MNKLKDKTSNVLAIIRSDIKRLSKSVVAIVCVFGLALIPCLYAWFNIISNWDPYTPDSTKNLTIAVASEDEGTTFVGLDLNVGNIIIEKLKGNNQINWQFVDSEQAVQDGLYSGDYYAGLVIPADFSDSLLGFTDGEFETPEIIYYDNQKMNAVASRVTDRAQSIVKNEVNSIFLASIVDELSNFTYLLRAAVGRGLRVVLNASPISEEVLAADLTGVDWLVVNEIECAAIAGCSTPEEGYAALRARYPRLGILLTLGSEGSVSWKDGVEIRQCAYPVQAVDTTGAGDTFMGYFVGCLAQGMERKDAMQYAAMAASIAVTRPGAAPSIPMMAEVRAAVEAL